MRANSLALWASLTFYFLNLRPSLAWAQHDAIITAIQGSAHLYSHPSKDPKGPSPRIQYNANFYTKIPAILGDKISNGWIVQTERKSKLRINFANGDSLAVGPNTFYTVSWKEKEPPLIDLLFGSIRSIILKGGPRSGSTFQSRSSVLGVRGTDFYMEVDALSTQVAVIRGEVAVNPKQAVNHKQIEAKPISLTAGFRAEITSEITSNPDKKVGPSVARAPVVKVNQTTKQDLIAIQKSSVLKPSPPLPNEKIPKSIEALNKLAAENVFHDVQKYNPALSQKIKEQLKNGSSLDSINTLIMKDSYVNAPLKAKTHKPSEEDLKLLDEDAYDRYQP